LLLWAAAYRQRRYKAMKLIYITLFMVSIISTGCLRTYFPSVYESSETPMIFEIDNNDTLSSKYISADLTLTQRKDNSESMQLMKANYIISHTKDHINTNVRLFGFSGVYNVSGLEKFNGTKTIFGFGGNLGVNFNFKVNEFRFGFGGNFGLGVEFGEYYSFRKTAKEEGIIKSETGLPFLSLTIFPILAYQFSGSTILSSQLDLGFPGLLSPSLVLNNNDNLYWLSWGPDLTFGLGNQNFDSEMGQRVAIGFFINLNKF